MHILIVDDEQTARYGIGRALATSGTTHEAGNLKEARKVLENHPVELILLDLNLVSEHGFDLLKEVQFRDPRPEVIVITAHGNERTAVQAMKEGAFNYLAKPFDVDELRLVVHSVEDHLELRRQNRGLRAELAVTSGFGDLIGAREPIQTVYALIERVAETSVTVLLTGESGSGKELVAREIHRRSARKEGPLVSVNCAAIPTDLIESELFGHEKGTFTGATSQRMGKFEQAHNGTLFLDEIGDMPPETQAKILRVLEDGLVQRLGAIQTIPSDVRILSATNKDLQALVREGHFRGDLYYRLQVVEINIPPLRRREDDIPSLIYYFLEVSAEKHGRPVPELEPASLRKLAQYSYPGNVRQLRNILERLVVLQTEGLIRESDLPDEVRFFVASQEKEFNGRDLNKFLELNYKEAKRAFEIRYLAGVQNTLTFTLLDADAIPVGGGARIFQPGEARGEFIDQIFPVETAGGFVGTVVITSDLPFAAVGIRTLGGLQLSSYSKGN